MKSKSGTSLRLPGENLSVFEVPPQQTHTNKRDWVANVAEGEGEYLHADGSSYTILNFFMKFMKRESH